MTDTTIKPASGNSYDWASSSPTGSGYYSVNPDTLALNLLNSMSKAGGVKPTGGGTGVGTGQTQTQRFSSQSYQATLPPPPAPKTTTTTSTLPAFQSFAQETTNAMQSWQQWAQTQPNMQNPSALINPGSASAAQISKDLAAWLNSNSLGVKSSVDNGGLFAFIKLRIENTDKSINSLQGLSSMSSDLESDLAKEEEAQAQAAQKEAHKANKKSGILGLFQKIFEVIIAIVCIALCFVPGCQAMAGIGCVLAAGAFVAAGAAKGAGHGGFDFWGGLEWFNNLASLGGAAFLIGAAGKAALTAVTKSISAVEEATANGLKGAAETAQLGKAGDTLSVTGEAGAESAASAAQEARSAAMSEATEELAASGERKAIKKSSEEIIASQSNVEKLFRKLGQFSADGNMAKEVGSSLLKGGFAVALLNGANAGGKAVIQLEVSLAQANADQDLAHITEIQAMLKLLDDEYKSAQDCIQALVKSHSNAIDAAQSVLKNNNQALNMIAANMSQM